MFSSLHDREAEWVRRFSRLERRPALRLVMLCATRCADGWILIGLIPLAVLIHGGRAWAATACGLAAGVPLALLVFGIKALVRRERPTVELERPITAPDRHSFPSGHSAHSFNVFVMLWWLSPIAGLVFLPVAVAAALSRVFFGLHYPSDVAVGAALGTILGTTAVLAFTSFGLFDWFV